MSKENRVSIEHYKVFLKLAWPCVVEYGLLAMVTMIDTMMVGTLGTASVAAVGVTGQPRFILLALTISLNVGLTSVIARRHGEKNVEGANAILKGALILGLLLGALTACIGIFFAESLLSLAGAEANYIEDAVIYFQIVSFGLFFQIINLIINACQRGVGNTKITMQTNVVANLLNVVFNYVLINGKLGFPALGIKGAAIATALGAMTASVIAMSTLLKKRGYLNLYIAMEEKISIGLFKSVFWVSSSALCEQIFARIGFFICAILAVRLGTIPYATNVICSTLFSLSYSIADGIGAAGATIVGQQLGAKDVEGAKMYGGIGQKIAFMVSSILFFVFILGRYVLIDLFTDDVQVMALGANLMILMAFITHLQTSQIVYNGCLRGAGDSKYVAMTSLLGITIIRPILTYLMCFTWNWGVYGIWSALFCDQVFRVTLAVKRFYGGKWSKIKL